MEMAYLVNDKNTKDITDREWEPYINENYWALESKKAWQFDQEES